MTTQHDCLALDAADPLAALREQFALPAGVTYLDGNSLGARPKAALKRAQQVLEAEWGDGLIRSWNSAGWFALPSRLGDKLAPLVGADKDEVVITDSTSVNLFKALAAAIKLQAADPARAQRRAIVTERDSFPTDIYMAQGLIEWLDRGYRLELVDAWDQLPAALHDDVAVLMLTHVNYRTGRMFDMASVTALAHEAGALVIWDLAHSAGAVEVDLNAAKADFAVGCTYKYLNGGPGSPAFIWVPRRHQGDFSQPLSGWWGHRQPFAMQPSFAPTAGVRRALCGTQPITSLALVECGLDVYEQVSMAALRRKSLALTDLFIALVEQHCGGHGLELVTPREHAQRGSHVSFSHPQGYAVMQSLIAHGVIGDYREPQVMRFGFTPLYTSYGEVWGAVQTLKRILDEGDYEIDAARGAVT
ncbi:MULTISPECIES: kynureninase [unclassified Janthinobacterium]|uniref:kynureninase n=1 Tax=unclassified Janthinobacterium TaxID=2610881 RepID=UPI0003491FA0|nr:MULTISPECIES: kynureninase [unclassified Janthinobacterium]MEC5159375.1 kynureninase [Janthinobacterium sp. CG_S6]